MPEDKAGEPGSVHQLMFPTRGQQTFPIKGQMADIFGFAGHMVSLSINLAIGVGT